MMYMDPMHSPRMQLLEQERKHREEKGIYQAPDLMMRAGANIIVALIFIGIAIVVFHLF
jgi:hypothetical protein